MKYKNNRKKYEKPKIYKERVFDNISLQVCGKTPAIKTSQCRRSPKGS